MLNRLLVPLSLLALLAACGGDGSTTETADFSLASEPIADIAAADQSLSTLAAALDAAGLAETLRGEGPFTVFAPTDDAFAQLPDGALDALLADPDALRDVLLYHVLPGELRAPDVLAESTLTTVLGAPITVQAERLTLNETVNLVATDIVAENGVIHVIDMVLLPPANDDDEDSDDDGEDDEDSDLDDEDSDMDDEDSDIDDEDSDKDDEDSDLDDEDSDLDDEDSDKDDDLPSIVDLAVGDPQFSTLVTALQTAHLVETLQGEGPFTVFAPTNEAFAKLPEGLLDDLLHDPEALAEILLYHVVPGDLRAADVVASSSLTTAQGADIEVQGEQLTLNGDVNLVATDIHASNGVVHVIDGVLIPPRH